MRELEQFPLAFGDILYEPGDAAGQVYFPSTESSLYSPEVGSRKVLEVGIVGNEGVAGLPVVLGVSVSLDRGLVQSAGTAMRMKAAVLRREFRRDGALQRLLHRHLHSLLTQSSQTAVCNRFHTVEARLARRPLMTHDRVESDEFRLTHEFLSDMLRVRREAVSKAAGRQCYRVVRDESDHVFHG